MFWVQISVALQIVNIPFRIVVLYNINASNVEFSHQVLQLKTFITYLSLIMQIIFKNVKQNTPLKMIIYFIIKLTDKFK